MAPFTSLSAVALSVRGDVEDVLGSWSPGPDWSVPPMHKRTSGCSVYRWEEQSCRIPGKPATTTFTRKQDGHRSTPKSATTTARD